MLFRSNLLSAIYCALTAYKIHANFYLAVGFGTIAAAAAAGVLRFGWHPRAFAHLNSFLSQFAAAVGTPMIMLLVTPASFRPAFLPNETVFAALCAIFLAGKAFFSEQGADNSRTAANVAALALLCYSGVMRQRLLPLLACAVFVLSTVVVGADRHRYLLGTRRENLFHYGLAASMYLFERCAGDSILFGGFVL